MATDAGSQWIRVWSWNPGAGASCREVPIELADEVRTELRAMGYVTWVTRGPVVRCDEMLLP